MDLLVVVNKPTASAGLKKKVSDTIRGVCVKYGVRAHIEFQGQIIKNEDRSLLRKIIEEGKTIYSSGTWFFDNRQIGLKQYILYSYSSKDSKTKSLFSKALHGKKSWYYKGKKKIVKEYSGLIDDHQIILSGKGGLLVIKSRQKDIERTFNNFGIEYKIKKIVYA